MSSSAEDFFVSFIFTSGFRCRTLSDCIVECHVIHLRLFGLSFAFAAHSPAVSPFEIYLSINLCVWRIFCPLIGFLAALEPPDQAEHFRWEASSHIADATILAFSYPICSVFILSSSFISVHRISSRFSTSSWWFLYFFSEMEMKMEMYRSRTRTHREALFPFGGKCRMGVNWTGFDVDTILFMKT